MLSAVFWSIQSFLSFGNFIACFHIPHINSLSFVCLSDFSLFLLSFMTPALCLIFWSVFLCTNFRDRNLAVGGCMVVVVVVWGGGPCSLVIIFLLQHMQQLMSWWFPFLSVTHTKLSPSLLINSFSNQYLIKSSFPCKQHVSVFNHIMLKDQYECAYQSKINVSFMSSGNFRRELPLFYFILFFAEGATSMWRESECSRQSPSQPL